MKTYKIYRYWIEIDGEEWSYVGRTSQSQRQRAWNHNLEGYQRCKKFWQAIQKYGAESFKYEVLWETSNEEESYDLEKMTIDILDSVEHGFNISIGGKVGTQGAHYSEESKRRLAQAHLGKPGTITGTHRSEETKHKISKAQKGIDKPKLWKPIAQYSLDGSLLKVYASIKEASEKTGILARAISQCLTGKSKTSGGYHWAYQLD